MHGVLDYKTLEKNKINQPIKKKDKKTSKYHRD